VTKRYAAYALAVVFAANFLSYLDRQIVSALEDQLTDAFHFDREGTQFGFLWTAFTLGYMIFAPVVGFLSDRHRRPWIFAVCVFLWSVATIGSGLARTAPLLYATRFFIGIGEAGCLVIGPTLLSDYFPKEVRGRALSVFFLGLPLGGTAGYIVGGVVAEHFGGWRNAFYFAGLPGFLVAVLLWLLVDPPRGGPIEESHARISGVKPYLDLLKNRTLLYTILAQAFAVIILVPLLHFGVKFFESKHQMSKTAATLTLGTIALVAGSLGNTLSGVIGDRLAKRMSGAYARLAAVAFAAGMPCLVLGFLADSRLIVLPALTVGAFCYFLCMPAVNTQIANAVSAQQRAMAYALAVFILHLLGDMSAPPLFGKVAGLIGSRETTFVVFSCTLLLASFFCFLASRSAARDEARFAAGPPGR
jgi:MFS family permease